MRPLPKSMAVRTMKKREYQVDEKLRKWQLHSNFFYSLPLPDLSSASAVKVTTTGTSVLCVIMRKFPRAASELEWY